MDMPTAACLIVVNRQYLQLWVGSLRDHWRTAGSLPIHIGMGTTSRLEASTRSVIDEIGRSVTEWFDFADVLQGRS